MPASGRRGFGFRKRKVTTAPASITALTIVTPPVITGSTANDGSLLSVLTPAVWSAGTGFFRVYQWFRDGTSISGATSSSYQKQAIDAGANITVKEQANNGALSTPSQSNAIGPIAAVAGDVTAPTLSAPLGTQTGASTADLGVTTNEANGQLYYVVTTSATPPTKAQVKAGQNHLGSPAVYFGNQAITTTGAKTASATGLTSSTVYYAYYMHEDAVGNQSTVSAASSFTTGSPLTLTNPTITKTSTGGAQPITWSDSSPDRIVGDDMYLSWTTNGVDPDNTAELTQTFSTSHAMYDPVEGTGTPITWTGFGPFAASTNVKVKYGYGRSGTAIAWSNILNVTTDAVGPETASAFATSTGTNKSQYVTVGGTGNLVVTGQGGFNNAPISARLNTTRTGKRYAEFTVSNSTTSAKWIGVDDGTTDLNSGFPRPGVTADINDGAGSTSIFVNGSAVQTGLGGPSDVSANGVKFGMEIDYTAGTVSFWRKNSGGSWAQIGTTVTGLTLTGFFPNVGLENSDTLTAKLNTGQDRTLSSGYVPYDN